METYLRPAEVGTILSCHPDYASTLPLPWIKIGKRHKVVLKADLESFIEKKKMESNRESPNEQPSKN